MRINVNRFNNIRNNKGEIKIEKGNIKKNKQRN